MTTPDTPGSSVTPGESGRPVHTGQKAPLEKADQCLAQSELPVFNSPNSLVPLGNMPSLQIEHLAEHSQVFQDFTNSDSRMSGQMSSPNELICKILDISLRDRSHRNPLGIGHTGNRSDHEHSVH